MTAELLNEIADDAETVVVSWLSPLHPTAITRRTDDPLPFILVHGISGHEDVDESWVEDVVSVHTLCARSGGEVAARQETDNTHRRMLQLARYLEDVDLPGGRKATIGYVKIFSRPHWEPYGDDQILRKVARYTIGLEYSSVP